MSICAIASPFRVANASIIMLLALVACHPTRRGAMAFRGNLHSHLIHRNLSRGAATQSVLARNNRIAVIASCKDTARFMSSTKYSHDDCSSMKVSELRELLKANGLPVSGIKAQLVERLSSVAAAADIKPEIVAEKPVKVAEKPVRVAEKPVRVAKKPVNIVQMRKAVQKEYDAVVDDADDDLAGLLTQLKNIKSVTGLSSDSKNVSGEDSLKEDNTGKRGKNPTSMPGNLVFAKEGDKDDDEWDDVDDDDFDSDDEDEDDFDRNKTVDPNETVDVSRSQFERPAKRQSSDTFREDFIGTRVFVQGLPKEATWKELKDHFKVAGEVVFASVSIDKRTGQSKQCGIVQFETPAEAQAAIRDMRNHPLDGATLYVRKDVQESRQGQGQGKPTLRESRRQPNADWFEDDDRSQERTAPPAEWKRANDEDEDGGGDDWYNLRDDELKEIEDLVEKRDKQRRMKNYKMSDQLREQLKEDFGVHLDDRLKLWWTDTKHGGVPGVVSEAKGEGRWGAQKSWRQIPTSPDSDAKVDSDLVMDLLMKRDRARKRRDFDTADALLKKAYDAPQGGLGLRIHDESRTWRIWTTERPNITARRSGAPSTSEKLTPQEMCLQIVTENEPEKVDEMMALLKKFPGREWNIIKKLKDRYEMEG